MISRTFRLLVEIDKAVDGYEIAVRRTERSTHGIDKTDHTEHLLLIQDLISKKENLMDMIRELVE